MTLKDWIKAALEERFRPVHLAVEDESHQHIGHAGWREGGETHFRLDIVAEAFSGKSRVERQRMVYSALGDLMRERVHALSIKASAPGEA